MRRPFVPFAIALLAILALVAMPHPALANNAQSADLSQMFTSSGGSAISFFNWTTFRNFLTSTFAQIIIALCILGAIWRLRQNFEWGEAGTTIALVVLALGVLCLLPSLQSMTSGALVP